MTTSINISSCFESPQSALISAFQRRKLDAFKYALENLQADPNDIDPRFNLSIFESVLKTPNSEDYIMLCIEYGADMYKKNRQNFYPIHYAVSSLCPNNLRAFFKLYDLSKINVRYNHENCLHMLIEKLPGDSNYESIAQCIKILLLNGCDPNMPNEKSRTPFFSLLKVQSKLTNQNELVDFFLENSSIDLYTYKAADMKRMFEKQNPHKQLPEKVEKVVDANFMLSLLGARKESEFETNFRLFKENSTKKLSSTANDENKSNSFAEDCAKFLYIAVQNNLENVVDLLVTEGVDVNKRATEFGEKSPPIFLACSNGYYRILELLLQSEVKPEVTINNKNLLHVVCHHFNNKSIKKSSKNSSVDYEKCFNLLIDVCDVNEKDDLGCTPLHYAVRYRNDEAIKALLKKSSYIGTVNKFGEVPVSDISRDVFEDFLDGCITTNVQLEGEPEIYIDYSFLKAPKDAESDDEFRVEIGPLQTIASNSELRPAILHPVLSSFMMMKWDKLKWFFYGNLLLFSVFMLSLIIFIVLCQSIPLNERSNSFAFNLFWILSVVSIILLALRELFQLILSPSNYLKSFINYFEIVLIILACVVLYQSNNDDGQNDDSTKRALRAVTILFAAYEFLQIVGTLPILSVSTHMVILKKVAITFLKSIALYSILLFAFALSFYTLFGGKKNEENESTPEKGDEGKSSSRDDASDDFNSFGHPGIAIIKTFVMLTGEFDASALDLERHASSSIIFVLFVFVVTIVLFNLLNALAVDDTQVIKAEGQLVDLCQRINVLNKYEGIILSLSNRLLLFKKIISVFPYTIPDCRIVIRPNKSNQVLRNEVRRNSRDVNIQIDDQELKNLKEPRDLSRESKNQENQDLQEFSKMDPKIMKAIRCVIDSKNTRTMSEEKEEKLWNQIKSMETQLKILTEMMAKKN